MSGFDSWKQGLATRYDGGAMFRRQEPRSLDDIDKLVQRQQQLRLNLGLERAGEIEKSVDSFADGEKFRMWHATARWNAIWFTFASYIGGVASLNMFMPQLKASAFIKAYKPLVMLGCVGYSLVSYQIFSAIAGFDKTMWNEYKYALCIK